MSHQQAPAISGCSTTNVCNNTNNYLSPPPRRPPKNAFLPLCKPPPVPTLNQQYSQIYNKGGFTLYFSQPCMLNLFKNPFFFPIFTLLLTRVIPPEIPVIEIPTPSIR